MENLFKIHFIILFLKNLINNRYYVNSFLILNVTIYEIFNFSVSFRIVSIYTEAISYAEGWWQKKGGKKGGIFATLFATIQSKILSTVVFFVFWGWNFSGWCSSKISYLLKFQACHPLFCKKGGSHTFCFFEKKRVAPHFCHPFCFHNECFFEMVAKSVAATIQKTTLFATLSSA